MDIIPRIRIVRRSWRDRKKTPIASWISSLFIGVVFVVCLCCFILFFTGDEDPYITGLEEVIHSATSMVVACNSDTILIEDHEQVRAAAQLILDGMDGNRTFAPSYAAGGKVYRYTFYHDDQTLYRVVLHPEIGQAINHILPDHNLFSDDQERKIRRYNSQFYANTNRGELIRLCGELLP